MIQRILLLVVFGFSSAGCTSLSVQSDFNEVIDFSAYRSFAFMSERPLLVASAEPVSPLLEGRLIRATTGQLVDKGFRQAANAEQADYVVSFTLGARDRIQVNSYPTTYRGFGTAGWGGAYHTNVDVRNYTEGTLAIDVFDVKRRIPVWHGWATKTISASDRRNPTPLIQEIVTAILAEFPPP